MAKDQKKEAVEAVLKELGIDMGAVEKLKAAKERLEKKERLASMTPEEKKAYYAEIRAERGVANRARHANRRAWFKKLASYWNENHGQEDQCPIGARS